MTNTATFIAPKRTETTTDGVITVDHREWTDNELVELVCAKSPELFTVPESHAQQVLRPCRSYQEVSAEVLEIAATITDNDDNDFNDENDS